MGKKLHSGQMRVFFIAIKIFIMLQVKLVLYLLYLLLITTFLINSGLQKPYKASREAKDCLRGRRVCGEMNEVCFQYSIITWPFQFRVSIVC